MVRKNVQCLESIQTETGGILISPIAGTTPLKPGSATLPFFGVNPIIVDNEGNELSGECEGKFMYNNILAGNDEDSL